MLFDTDNDIDIDISIAISTPKISLSITSNLKNLLLAIMTKHNEATYMLEGIRQYNSFFIKTKTSWALRWQIKKEM